MDTLRVRIRKKITEAVSDYGLIESGDRIMICVSGGKDSTILALMLKDMQSKAPIDFTLQAVMLDQRQPGFYAKNFQDWLAEQGLPLTVIEEDTYKIVKQKTLPGKSFCGLCSRLRRGVFYNYAESQGYSKIALGHHRDDLNETVLLNLFYNGRIAGMPAKLLSDDQRNIVIRPMVYVPEAWLKAYAAELKIPVIPCNLCGSQDNLKRAQIKSLLQDLEKSQPGIAASMLSAQQNVRSSQLLIPSEIQKSSNLEMPPEI